MPTIQLIIVCATVITLALIAARSVQPRRTAAAAAPAPAGADVVVHTRDERSLRGRIEGADVDALVLSDVSLVIGGEAHPVGGLVRIPRSNESWVQILDRTRP